MHSRSAAFLNKKKTPNFTCLGVKLGVKNIDYQCFSGETGT